MAEEMSPKIDVAFDTSSNPKSENLPVQVTSIRLNKDNYLSWSAALEIGITSRSRLPYITGKKPAPNIQPLILRKSTSYDMWIVLARMYGRKKRVLRTYQIKRSIYSLKQGDLSVASFYAALKTKWEELDYHVNDDWHCGPDHVLYWENKWMDRTFIFLGGLRDEYESIRSQILNCDEIPGIEDVYARVDTEEQRRQVMHIDSSHGSAPSAFVSCSSVTGQRPVRWCSHCNKSGHSVDFCWDLHPEKRLVRGRPPSSRRGSLVQDSNQSGSSSGEKSRLSPNQIKELQAYIGRLSTTPEDSSTSNGAKLAQALVATSDKGNPSLDNWIVDSVATHHKTGDPKMFQDYKLTSGQQRVSMADDTVSEDRDSQMEGGPVEEQSRDHLFSQVYNRKKKDVVENVDVTNPNLVSSPDDPSPMNEELSIALRKGTSELTVPVGANTGMWTPRVAYGRETTPMVAQNNMDPFTPCSGRALIPGCVNFKERYSAFPRTPRLGRREPNAPSTTHNSTLEPCTACAPNRRDHWRKRDVSQTHGHNPLASHLLFFLIIIIITHSQNDWLAHEVGSLHECIHTSNCLHTRATHIIHILS
ncbi:hypothetical protein EJ110_NYTH58242 [Nymphaea thermarum]|nr:hypothetical protein EJ110_NYTH58242 [Nymphaea thermarum]